MKRGWKIFIGVLALAVLLAAIYFSFFFHYKCDGPACFKEHQAKCAPTIYVRDGDEVVWQYHIMGKEKNVCQVELTLVQVKKGTLDKQSLEGKAMICEVPLGEGFAPESDLKECHGLLKEEIQEIMIKNAHAQILANLGEIDDALNDVV